MVVFCSGFIGLKSAAALKIRVDFINSLILCTDKISQYIKMGTAEKSEILKNVLPAFLSYENGEIKTDKSIKITEEDRRLIGDFFEGLGMGDIEAERTRCLAFKGLFEKQLYDAEKQVLSKHKLFSVGGFLVGIILSFMWW